MQTVATPKSRGRRIGLLALFAAAITLGLTVMPMTAGAVHNGPFELDGDALADPSSAPPDDWGTLFPDDNSSTDLGHSFVTDKGESGPEPDDGYGSGQTKDTVDVPSWSAVNGAISPEKDDILHAYAATYVSGGDQLLYFGQDRAPKPNGSTSMGFWFFQDKVAPDGAGGFNGHHIDGDVLITSDMTQGGSVSVVNIFRWQDGALHSVASLTDAECGSAPEDSLACAIANESGPIEVPWSYPADEVPQNIFFEGGINLSKLFPGQTLPCFSSFLANTRTSPSETADLKDFAAGAIDTCGTITIHKDAQPNPDDPSTSFGFSATGKDVGSFSLTDGGSQRFGKLQPGPFSVNETTVPSDWVFDDVTCTTDEGTSWEKNGSQVSITLGRAGDVDCIYVNKREPRVKLVKDLDPDNDSGRFDFTLNGTTSNNGGQGYGNGDTTGFVNVPAGAVTIAESAHAGTVADKYASSVSCDSGKGSAGGTGHGFSIANGDSVTCTFTNHRKRGTLIVEKVVVNDNGGMKTAGNFSFQVNGGAEASFEADGRNELIVDSGSYSVTEPPVEGYATSYSSNCGNLVVPDGGSATCTITNDDQPAKLIVKKVVVNDDGGTKEAKDFSFRVNGGSAVQFETDGQNDLTVDAGTYNVTEPDVAGYATSYADCSNIVLANGETKTCTITNDDAPAKLIVKKVVVNDEGGAKEAKDFSFRVNGGSAVQFEADGQNEVDVEAGTYNVTEPTVDGYTTTYAGCSNIVLANGETKTCTITNDDDIPPTVEVTKTADPASLPEPGGNVTFTVVVHNTSQEAVTLTSLMDDPDDGGPLPAVSLDGVGTCDVPQQLAADATYTCAFQRAITGDAGDSKTDRVVATVRDDENDEAGDDDDATVTITDVPPAISVEKTANPTSVSELGGNVEFTVKVTNGSEIEVLSLTSLVDDKFGDLDGKGTCDVPQQIAVGGSYTCTFTEHVSGNAGRTHVNTVTATGSDDDENEVSAKDDATVTFTNVPPTVEVTKDANVESVDEPGGDVIFTVSVWNTSHEAVTVTSLVDSVYGNLDKDDVGNHSWVSSLCDTGAALVATDGTKGGGDTYSCTFVGSVRGEGPGVHENEVTGVVTDDDDSTATDKDTATVAIKDVPPPPPPPPAPQIDLSVTKVDAPDPAKLNGQIGYTMLVKNAGPSTATGVTLADPLPAGTSFVSVKTTQGTCSFSGGLVQCNLGTIPAGGSVAVTLIVKATRPGLLTNEVTVVGKEPESNTANNKARTTTLVPTPLVPPKPKPVCSTLTVGPKSLRVGKRSTIAATVKNRGKAVRGAKVRVRGAGIFKSGRTNARGKAHIRVRPVRPGIVVVSVPQKLVCGSKRIGVVGVFEPPVTG
jgi:uncharacterized repeat protein (TIGR01451 family)